MVRDKAIPGRAGTHGGKAFLDTGAGSMLKKCIETGLGAGVAARRQRQEFKPGKTAAERRNAATFRGDKFNGQAIVLQAKNMGVRHSVQSGIPGNVHTEISSGKETAVVKWADRRAPFGSVDTRHDRAWRRRDGVSRAKRLKGVEGSFGR